MSTATKQANVLDSIGELLQSLNKQAEESHTEAGGYDGPTEHPVKKEEDRTEEAYVGSRARENEEDVKEDQGEPAVDGEPQKSAEITHDQDAVQLNIGTKQRATGEDSASETDRAKPGKDDAADGTGGSQGRGESSHPARTNNNEIDGHKWASKIASIRDLIGSATEQGNEYLGAVSVSSDTVARQKAAELRGEKQAMCESCKNDPCSCPGGKCAEDQAGKEAGAALADAVTGEGQVEWTDKQAQDAQVVNAVADTIQLAWRMADKTAAYVQSYEKHVKKSMEMGGEEGVPGTNPPSDEEESEAPPEEMGGEGGGDPSGEGGSPEGGAPAGGGEEELLAALTGGGGGDPMGGGMPPGEDPMAAMGGGDPMGGGAPPIGGDPMGGGAPPMGGTPPMGGDPMGGGMGGDPAAEELAMLLAALQQAGIDPAMLEAGAQAKAASFLAMNARKAQEKQAAAADTTQWQPKTAEEAQKFQNLIKVVREMAAVK